MPDFPIPPIVFNMPDDTDWTSPDHYPARNETKAQRWAWEFLRRSARYDAAYQRLQQILHDVDVEDVSDRVYANSEVDRFCLMWQIAKPLDSATAWDDLDCKTQLNLIGPPPLKAVLPALSHLRATDEVEIGLITDETVPMLQSQVLVRLSVGADPILQVKEVTRILEELRQRIPVRVGSGEEKASLYDYAAPLRYVRLAPGLVAKRGGDIINEITFWAYGRTRFRVTTPLRLHLALRTLDAMAQAREIRRDELGEDESFFGEDGKEDTGAKRRWLCEYPFGESADEWVRPLSQHIAETLRKECPWLDPRRINDASVREWMRMARYYVLEQGYVQVAMSKLRTGADH
jgi:Family of unknown function (DUF6499)